MTTRRCVDLVGPLLLAALLAAAAAPQQPTPIVKQRYQELVAQLTATPPPTHTERIALLRRFVAEHGQGQARSLREAMQGRLHLGHALLQQAYHAQQGVRDAIEVFEAVAEDACSRQPDLHARAIYGLHKGLLLDGQQAAARQLLTSIAADFAGTEAADCARQALVQLDHAANVRAGERLTPLDLGRDRHGRPVELRRGRQHLIVFWSLQHPTSVRRLEELVAAWSRAGRDPATLVGCVLEPESRDLDRFLRQRRWSFPVVPGGGHGYGPDAWLQLGVKAVPSVFLLDGDGRLLAVDIPPSRLERLLGVPAPRGG